MIQSAQLWADPRLVYSVATIAVALLLVTIWLFQRKRRHGRQAGLVCLFVSIALHVALIILVPMVQQQRGGTASSDVPIEENIGVDSVQFSSFDDDLVPADAAGRDEQAAIAPLPVADLLDLTESLSPAENETEQPPTDPPATLEDVVTDQLPTSLASAGTETRDEFYDSIDSEMEDWLATEDANVAESTMDDKQEQQLPDEPATPIATAHVSDSSTPANPASARAPKAMVPGALEADFANRTGAAKQTALARTGGEPKTEAAVEAALKFLAQSQRADGAWDPRASGAGKERQPLGMSRGGAGLHAESALTGLALLSLMGAGQTHQQGEYADNAYRGLVYLIRNQKPDGSLAGDASVYAANYSHGMAALAMGEAAAITKDASAVISARRAISHTLRMQHPTTGGWRYTSGDPGDLSQLGWQAMVLDAGHRAQIPVDRRSVAGVERFLRSVRAGTTGGLASYRAGEATNRTMTAEALATRLLIGQRVPDAEIDEAERYLLQQLPGVGQDNYYYWYYATLALHQLQDDAWREWNAALKKRLLETQLSDGSWPADTLWGGYGGKIYTTSMATLCLEVYYRHAIRSDQDRIAHREPASHSPPPTRR